MKYALRVEHRHPRPSKIVSVTCRLYKVFGRKDIVGAKQKLTYYPDYFQVLFRKKCVVAIANNNTQPSEINLKQFRLPKECYSLV